MTVPYTAFSSYSLFVEELVDEELEPGVAFDELWLSEEAPAGLSAPVPESPDFAGPLELPLAP